MLKKVIQYIIMAEPINNLTKEQKCQIQKQIDCLNYERFKIYLKASVIIEAMLIFFYDLPHIHVAPKAELWEYQVYCLLHSLLFITGITGALYIERRLNIINSRGKSSNVEGLILVAILVIEFIYLSGIDIMDQFTKGSSMVLLVNFFLCCAALNLRFPYNMPVYTIPYVLYVAGLINVQKEQGIMIANLINGSILYLGVVCISSFVYSTIFGSLYRNIVLQEVNEKLNYLSAHDSLTSLFNRGSFEEKAKKQLKDGEERRIENAILLVDIDHFKQVNDTFGHPIGDMVLQKASAILLEEIEGRGLATRWGGEEFLLLLPDMNYPRAMVFAEKIRKDIEKDEIIIEDKEIHITVSIGVSTFTGSFEESFKYSYKQVDRALYEAKKSGRNLVIAADYH